MLLVVIIDRMHSLFACIKGMGILHDLNFCELTKLKEIYGHHDKGISEGTAMTFIWFSHQVSSSF